MATRFMINWKHLTSFSLFILTACAPPQAPDAIQQTSLSTTTTTASIETPKLRSAKNISSWTIAGVVAAKNKKEAWSASLNWKQRGINNYQIHLYGPLGSGSILIENKNGEIIYQDGQKRIISHHADNLMKQQTGIRFPFQALYYWIRGLPAPGTVQSAHYDQAGRLIELKQAGHVIQYMRYTNKQGIDLPSKLYVQGVEGKLKLIIKHWDIR